MSGKDQAIGILRLEFCNYQPHSKAKRLEEYHMAKQNPYPQQNSTKHTASQNTNPAFWAKGGNRPGNSRDRMRPGDKAGDK